jgi:hypothetical protein
MIRLPGKFHNCCSAVLLKLAIQREGLQSLSGLLRYGDEEDP